MGHCRLKNNRNKESKGLMTSPTPEPQAEDEDAEPEAAEPQAAEPEAEDGDADKS